LYNKIGGVKMQHPHPKKEVIVMKRIVILLLIVSICVLYAAQPKTLRQMVRHWPDTYGKNGIHWVVYYIDNAKDSVLYDTSYNSETIYSGTLDAIRWNVEGTDFGGPPYGLNDWSKGDSLIAFGSWDSVYYSDPGGYGSKANHIGFYWLFSDTLTTEDPQTWVDDDTLRPIPKPIVTKTGPGGGANDTIWITIPNPRETRRPDQSGVYDVLGYWLFADTTTAAGTPDAYAAPTAMEIAFIPVEGVYGENTVYWMLESDGFDAWNTWTVYFAYKLVARPDTTGGVDNLDSPGHASYYFSQNSDPVIVYQNVIGIEENKDINHSSMQLEISPNPFTDRTDITCSIGQSAKSTELKIYDISGKLVKDFSLPTAYSVVPTVVPWDGTDESGELLPSGVYFIQAKGGDLNLTKKVILQR
jgi:hypothetical protein